MFVLCIFSSSSLKSESLNPLTFEKTNNSNQIRNQLKYMFFIIVVHCSLLLLILNIDTSNKHVINTVIFFIQNSIFRPLISYSILDFLFFLNNDIIIATINNNIINNSHFLFHSPCYTTSHIHFTIFSYLNEKC